MRLPIMIPAITGHLEVAVRNSQTRMRLRVHSLAVRFGHTLIPARESGLHSGYVRCYTPLPVERSHVDRVLLAPNMLLELSDEDNECDVVVCVSGSNNRNQEIAKQPRGVGN